MNFFLFLFFFFVKTKASPTRLPNTSFLLAAVLFVYLQNSQSSGPDNDDMDAYKTELEARSKLEVRQTLTQVNRQLDAHAQQTEKLFRMQENSEAQLRREFEKTKRDLMVNMDDRQKNI